MSILSSIGNNKYKVRFDNGSTKDVNSTLIQIEESTVGVSPSETVALSRTFTPPEPSTTSTQTITDSITAGTPTGLEAVEEIE